MPDATTVRRCRKALLIGSVAVFVVIMTVIVIAFIPSGNWLEIQQTSPVEVSLDGSDMDVSFTVDVTSRMPYDVDDLGIALVLTDRGRGSSVPLYSADGIRLAANETTSLTIETSIWMPATLLTVRDLAMRDGAPLHLELTASCGYLGGLASFRLTSDLDVPVTAEGEKISYAVVDDTMTSFSVRVDGLADWLVPGDRSLTVSGGGETATLTVSNSDGTAVFSATSDSGLDGVLGRIASADDLLVVDEEGDRIDLDADALRTLDSLLEYARGMQ